MNKIFRKVFMIASLFSAGLLTSCEMDDPEVENTAVAPMAGEWFVQWDVADGSGGWEHVADYSHIMTASTSNNTDSEMWVGDVFDDPRNLESTTIGSFWTFMVRAKVDLGAMTFTANDKSIATVGAKAPTPAKPAGTPAVPYDINVKIMDGKIIKDGSTPPSGTTTDSIQFQIEFGDDPGTIYRASGYRRTGFLEDEH